MISTERRSGWDAIRSIFGKGGGVKAPPKASEPDSVEGRLNGVQGHLVLGWAFDANAPEAHVDVEVLVDGQPCAVVRADLFREDLLKNGKGRGDHGYAWPVDERFFDSAPHTIAARIKGRTKPFKGAILNRVLSRPAEGPQAPVREPTSQIAGRLEGVKAGELIGWAFDRNDPAAHVELALELDGRQIGAVIASELRRDLAREGIGAGDHGFRWNIPPEFYDLQFTQIAAKAVRHGVYLRGSIDRDSVVGSAPRLAAATATASVVAVSTGPASGAPVSARPELSKWRGLLSLRRPRVTVIVPVYNALDETRRCIQALLAHTTYDCELLIINDCSPDPAIRPMLDACVGLANVRIHHNEANLGFTRTVATGIAMAGTNDVVLLNSDTRVTPRWLENLVLAAHEDERIGTVTPLSDNAGPFSVPNAGGNTIPAWLTDEQMSRVVSHASAIEWPRTPTANGFCAYVRRDYLDDVGTFDAEAFPRGYGEENEFSMRGVRRGWRHKIDDRTFIFHERSASFGEAKTALLAAGRAVVDERFPEYTGMVRAFVAGEELKRVRERVRASFATIFLLRAPPKKRMLFVINKETGGTPQTNRDLMGGLEANYECFVLRSDAKTLVIEKFAKGVTEIVCQHTLAVAIDIKTHRSEEYDNVVSGWLIMLAIEMVHVRHIGLHSLDLITVSKLLGIPVIVSFHDFYTVCPNTKLLDRQGVHCKGVCTDGEGDCSVDLWPAQGVPPLRRRWVGGWREMVGATLGDGAAYVTTSESAAALVKAAYPDVAKGDFRIIEHGRDFTGFREPVSHPIEQKIRILVPGNINAAKGALIIRDLKRLDAGGRLEFHVFGNVSRDFDSSSVILHGPYNREDAVDKFRSINPHFGMILSIWPETYCHTLTEMWAAGIPVAGFDIGAVGERLHQHGGGWPLSITDVETLYATLVAMANEVEIGEKNGAVRAWQLGDGAEYGVARMAERYVELYEDVAARQRKLGDASAGARLEAAWNAPEALL